MGRTGTPQSGDQSQCGTGSQEEASLKASRIAEALCALREELRALAQQSGRPPEAIKLIAVSKTHAVALLQEAWEAGQTCFGESRIQEALSKIPLLPNGLEWHFIGRLQQNKAKFCLGNFQWLHSLDSWELAQALEKQGLLRQIPLKALVQVNLSGESTKGGLQSWDELCRFAEKLIGLEWVQWKGLMTMPAPTRDEVATRRVFEQLAAWRERLAAQFGNGATCTELSMGMSSDYAWAIAEGATMVRIGSAIFGERPSFLRIV